MSIKILLVTLCVVTGCRPHEKSGLIDSTSVAKEVRDSVNDSGSIEEDCVFNNDYQGLTTAWLNELNSKPDFIWQPDHRRALVLVGEDSIFVSKGGCTHFNIAVEIKLANDLHPISDSTYWVTKALKLADDFEMESYSKIIRNKSIRKAGSSDATTWYEIEDDNTEDNLYLDGIEISVRDGFKVVSLSEYYN